MNQVDRLEKVVSQLIGDIAQLPGVTLDKAGEAQLGQLITDAFEQVGHIALDAHGIIDDSIPPDSPFR